MKFEWWWWSSGTWSSMALRVGRQVSPVPFSSTAAGRDTGEFAVDSSTYTRIVRVWYVVQSVW